MSFYQINLAVFVAANVLLLSYLYRIERRNNKDKDEVISDEDRIESETENLLSQPPELETVARRLQWEYYIVYAFAVAADWLQGPHIYAIYKYEKALPEKLVAGLYATGFISGAVAASFTGALADRYGRRIACIVYCAAYILTCASMLSDQVVVLFIGRICGGIATTLLFSVFEAWLVTEYHQRNLQRSHMSLSAIFGNVTTLSSVVAIASGVIGDILVDYSNGARIWPFVAAGGSAVCAMVLIIWLWPENYGGTTDRDGNAPGPNALAEGPDSNERASLLTMLGDRRIWGIGLTSTFFEGTMYLFVFFWSAALKSARNHAGSDEELPFGLIFSSFMCAMMAGSALFSLVVPSRSRASTPRVLMGVVLVVSCCLSGVVLLKGEKMVFWLLCTIELCIGAYYPSMSYLKSEVVEDGMRGRVYSFLRLPLNTFVVVVHSLDREGDAHRNHVFLTCAGLLMASFFVVKWGLST